MLLLKKIKFLCFIVIVSFMALLSGVVYTYFAQNVFEAILSKQELLNPILLLASILIIILLLKAFISIFRFYLEKEKTISLQNALLESLYGATYFYDYIKKENINLIYQNAEAYSTTYYEWVQSVVINSVVVMTTAVYFAYIDRSVLVISTLILLFLLFISFSNQKKVQELQSDFMEKNNQAMAIGWEHITNREISSLLNTNKVFQNYNEKITQVNDAMISMKKVLFKNQYMSMFGVILANFFTALFGGYLCLKQVITIADLFGMVTLITIASRAVLSIPVLFDQKSMLKGMKQPMENFLHLERYLEDEKNEIKEKIKQIVIQDVSLKVEKKELLKKGSVQLESGKIYMLSGESGCGKTTLLKAIMGLYPMEEGQIFYERESLEQLNRKSVWKKIAYLSQVPVILSTTLERNITGLEKDFNESKFLELVWQFHLQSFIGQPLQEEKLSSGERQKVAACRCFYGDFDVLFLDEPTSAMDEEGEHIFWSQLRRYVKEKKAIVLFISHRQSDLKRGDVQLRMKNQRLEVVQ